MIFFDTWFLTLYSIFLTQNHKNKTRLAIVEMTAKIVQPETKKCWWFWKEKKQQGATLPHLPPGHAPHQRYIYIYILGMRPCMRFLRAYAHCVFKCLRRVLHGGVGSTGHCNDLKILQWAPSELIVLFYNGLFRSLLYQLTNLTLLSLFCIFLQ